MMGSDKYNRHQRESPECRCRRTCAWRKSAIVIATVLGIMTLMMLRVRDGGSRLRE
jgi:hypothetical protein